MALRLQKGEVVTDPRMHGEAEPCRFCVRSIGTCTTSIVCKKSSSTCPCVVPLKHAMAMRKQESVPRECLIPGCSATPWVLNIKTHLARCHPTVAPNTVDLTEWVVVSQEDENKKGQPKSLLAEIFVEQRAAIALQDFRFRSGSHYAPWPAAMDGDYLPITYGDENPDTQFLVHDSISRYVSKPFSMGSRALALSIDQ